MSLLLFLLLILPSVAVAQSSTSTDIGNTTFYNSDERRECGGFLEPGGLMNRDQKSVSPSHVNAFIVLHW